MKNVTTYVGVYAHEKDLFVAMLIGTSATPVTWQLATSRPRVRHLVKKLEREAPGPVQVCDEAGPGGYALQRQMTTARVSCQVIAPALFRASRESASRRIAAMRQVGGAAPCRIADGSPAADARRRSGPRSVPGT